MEKYSLDRQKVKKYVKIINISYPYEKKGIYAILKKIMRKYIIYHRIMKKYVITKVRAT